MAAPETPPPAASEGVAMPARMVPITAKLNTSGGTMDLTTIHIFRRGA